MLNCWKEKETKKKIINTIILIIKYWPNSPAPHLLTDICKYFTDDSSINCHDIAFLHFLQKMKKTLVMKIYGRVVHKILTDP